VFPCRKGGREHQGEGKNRSAMATSLIIHYVTILDAPVTEEKKKKSSAGEGRRLTPSNFTRIEWKRKKKPKEEVRERCPPHHYEWRSDGKRVSRGRSDRQLLYVLGEKKKEPSLIGKKKGGRRRLPPSYCSQKGGKSKEGTGFPIYLLRP